MKNATDTFAAVAVSAPLLRTLRLVLGFEVGLH